MTTHHLRLQDGEYLATREIKQVRDPKRMHVCPVLSSNEADDLQPRAPKSQHCSAAYPPLSSNQEYGFVRAGIQTAGYDGANPRRILWTPIAAKNCGNSAFTPQTLVGPGPFVP